MKNLKLTPLPQLPLCLDRSREGEGWALPSELSQLPVHGAKKKKKKKRLEPLKSHGWFVLKQAGQCHIHCFKLLCWKKDLDDVTAVSQCGVGSRSGEVIRRSSGVQS